MPIISWLRTVVQTWFRRDDVYRDLDEEMASSLELLVDEKIAAGADSDTARHQALLELGGIDRVREQVWESRAGTGLGHLAWELRHALRTLKKWPGFSAVAILSLAIGIGVNAVLFTIFQAAFLRPVPGIAGADRVVEMVLTRRGEPDMECLSWPDFLDMRSAATLFETLAGFKPMEGSLSIEGVSERVPVMAVTPGYLAVLGVTPIVGRDFSAADEGLPGQHPVAIMSHAFWQNRFGGASDIIGRTITLNRTPYTVIGITPESFQGHRTLGELPVLWVPIGQHRIMADENNWREDRAALWVQVLGRLKPDATVEKAEESLQALYLRLADEYPESNTDRSVRCAPFGPMPAANRSGEVVSMGLLFAFTGLILLIICGNLAGMMRARNAARQREIAVRLALGSGRGHLIRSLLSEALVLSLIGGGLGILLSFWIASATPLLQAAMISAERVSPNGTILLFSLVVIVLTALLFGLLPALRFSRPELVSLLHDGARGSGRRISRLHRFTASSQAGLALLLLMLSVLFLRAVDVMNRTDPGFDPDDLYLMSIDISSEGYEDPALTGMLIDRLRTTIAAVPGVRSTAVSDGIPLDHIGNFTTVTPAGEIAAEGSEVEVEFTKVTAGFFATTGIPVVAGRGIEDGDDAVSEPVVVITRSLAERLWPGESPLGRRVSFPLVRSSTQTYTVVGVVPRVASSRATQDLPHVFVSLHQNVLWRIMIVVRTEPGMGIPAGPLLAAVAECDPELALPEIVPVESLVSQATQEQRMTARITGGLGLLALLLTAIGVYAVVSFVVAGRTREIGIRMAMGASWKQVQASVIWYAIRLAAPGLIVGVLAAVGLASGMRSMLFGLSPLDPLALGGAVCLLAGVVVLASLIPARRAAGIEPVEALRAE